MSRELKKYRLRATRKPMSNAYLASAVKVIIENGAQGYCYIGFDEHFVSAVGKRLPRGVATYDPAYIEVHFNRYKKAWVISACYFSSEDAVILWESAERPAWLKYLVLKAHQHGTTDSTNAHSTTSTGHAASNPRQGYALAA